MKARSTIVTKKTTYSTYFLILQSEADQNVIQQTATSAEVGLQKNDHRYILTSQLAMLFYSHVICISDVTTEEFVVMSLDVVSRSRDRYDRVDMSPATKARRENNIGMPHRSSLLTGDTTLADGHIQGKPRSMLV